MDTFPLKKGLRGFILLFLIAAIPQWLDALAGGSSAARHGAEQIWGLVLRVVGWELAAALGVLLSLTFIFRKRLILAAARARWRRLKEQCRRRKPGCCVSSQSEECHGDALALPSISPPSIAVSG